MDIFLGRSSVPNPDRQPNHLPNTSAGGRYADYITNKWTSKRGVRVPEDRLRSALPFLGIVIPAAMLIYGVRIPIRQNYSLYRPVHKQRSVPNDAHPWM